MSQQLGKTLQKRCKPAALVLLFTSISAGCTTERLSDVGVDLAIDNVNLIDVETGSIVPARSVYIRGDTIVKVVAASDAQRPAAATRIDASDQFLLPAFSDMHVHIAEPWGVRGQGLQQSLPAEILDEVADEVFLYVAKGVTLVRNMDGWPLHLALRKRIADGDIIGPEIVTAGPIIYGPGRGALYASAEKAPGAWVDSPEAARELVRAQIEQGFDFIKIYNSMSPETYASIINTANQLGVKVAGHIPFDVGIYRALEAGQDSIEHLRGYDIDPWSPPDDPMSNERFAYWLEVSDDTMAEYARLTATADVYNCPTLVVGDGFRTVASGTDLAELPNTQYMTASMRDWSERFTIFSDESIDVMLSTSERVQAMIRALNEAGAPIMLGTDTPIYFGLPGFSLHRELEIYVEAGLTPVEALRNAILTPSAYLGRNHRRGRIAEGYEADLILLRANPVENISNTRTIAGVVTDGKWLDRSGIDTRLEQIAARGAARASE